MEGVRETTVIIGEKKLHLGIAHGLGNARILMDEIKNGNPRGFDVIEVMACPGGCIGGAGQPYHHGDMEILAKRRQALYIDDASSQLRKSHENPDVMTLYNEYLGKPLSHKAHELLHTSYSYKKRI